MMSAIKKLSALMVLLLVPCFWLSALQGTISEHSGKVEILSAGKWTAAEKGMTILPGTTISTGFNSSALIDLGEATIEVKALTRMTLEELADKDGVRETGLYLRVGKVKADVRRTEATRQNFRVRSSVATAAVRGTSFEFDGFNLEVLNGSVRFLNTAGNHRLVLGGEISSIIREAVDPSSPLAELLSGARLPDDFMSIFNDIPQNEIEQFVTAVIDQLDQLENYVPVTINPQWPE